MNGKQIWFVSVNTENQIHAQALGFTKQFYSYAYAADAVEAGRLCEAWYGKQGIPCLPISEKACQPAHFQRFDAYTFPHQIINIPSAELEAIYDRRGYPESYRDKAHCI